MGAPGHDILITIDEAFVAAVAEDYLARIARRVLKAEDIEACELGVVVTGDETLRRLNREYAGQDYATDVLSFSLREGEEFASADGVLRLGEVIISHPAAERQAVDAGRSAADEVAHLLVHGILHLLGYDHTGPADERRMRTREVELLGSSAGHSAL